MNWDLFISLPVFCFLLKCHSYLILFICKWFPFFRSNKWMALIISKVQQMGSVRLKAIFHIPCKENSSDDPFPDVSSCASGVTVTHTFNSSGSMGSRPVETQPATKTNPHRLNAGHSFNLGLCVYGVC